MMEPILTGFVAALFFLLPAFLQDRLPLASWSVPIFILAIGIWNAFFGQFLTRKNLDGDLDGERYDGLADFLIYIHSPKDSAPFIRWLARTFNSFLLTLAGGCVGAEGAAIEAMQTIRVGMKINSARWFEQRRRTEVSMGIAGGISAAFHAPFAGILLPIELGLGGRSLYAVVAALTAFVTVEVLSSFFSLQGFNFRELVSEFALSSWKQGFELASIGIFATFLGIGITWFLRFIRGEFLKVFRSYAAIGSLVVAGVLVMVYLTHPISHQFSWLLLENVLKAKFVPSEVGFFFALELLSLSIVLAAFGTMGVFWPILMLGGLAGFGLHQQIFHPFLFAEGSPAHLGAASGLVGAAALFGVVFGAPITGSLLVFEMTGNFQVFLPALLASILAYRLSKLLNAPSLLSNWLRARGHALLEGRSSRVLENIRVEQAMVTDYQTVFENEPLTSLHGKINDSRYPFLPVLNSRSQFVGLLTVDMIEESWKKQISPASASLISLLEAKDLLYRFRTKNATLKQNDPLSMTRGMFSELPCVPVLSEDGGIVGLLFVHNVRLAYDRETIFRRY